MPLRQIVNEHLSEILFNSLISEWSTEVKSAKMTFDEVVIEVIFKRNNFKRNIRIKFLG